MRFCPQCGAPLTAGARFCVECGRALQGGSPAGGRSPDHRTRGDLSLSNIPITTAFVGVFLAITIVGLGAAGWIMLGTPNVMRGITGAPGQAPSNSVSAPEQGSAAANGGASGGEASAPAQTQGGQLPPGHPKIELPTEARTFIDKVERDARAKPNDVVLWTRFGAVAMRAAMLDDSYYAKAEEAYGHVLKLSPDNLDALRGIGDIDYDKKNYDQAVAAYEHYLKRRPNDPEVRTDLGTMYLYTGNADQAVVQYQKAIKAKPGFYQAYFNMGVAYAEQNQADKANAALAQALKLAPDENAKSQVRELIARISGAPNGAPAPTAGGAGAAEAAAPAPPTPAAPAPAASSAAASTGTAPAAPASPAAAIAAAGDAGAAAAGASAAPATTFHGAIEQMVRSIPFAGPKVGAVQWPDQLKARVMMEDFPMDQMPPFAKDKFLSDLKDGIDSAKKQYGVSGKVEVDIVDGVSGNVMQTMTE